MPRRPPSPWPICCSAQAACCWPAAGGAARPLSADTTLVAFASQTGFAEELARATAADLAAGGEAVEVVELGALSAEALIGRRRALFVVATTGEGDAPDGAARFVRTAMAERRNLSALETATLAPGDSGYADFCAFGRRLDSWLADSGARPLFERVEVDAGDPAALAAWREAVGRLSPGAVLPELAGKPPTAWRLASRRCLNPEGEGAPVFLIELAPPSEYELAWQAGDVIEIERVVDGVAHHREYSIASIPTDGRLDLVVRRQVGPDGAPGLMSGWLTRDAALDTEVSLRLRSNRTFHAVDDGPMLLIGAGTGIAGLRAHIKARRAAGAGDCWLIYGERTRDRDFLLGDEVEAWRTAGTLNRADLAFSRDQAERVYVQDLLVAAAVDVRAALKGGASIFVCGGREGMGRAVHQALTEIIGAPGLQKLTEGGRYRRDVY